MWKMRVYRSLPYVIVLASAAGIAITDEVWFALVGLIGMWLLDSPVGAPSSPSENKAMESFTEFRPAPCQVMHGAADPHVLGCEGWSNPPG